MYSCIKLDPSKWMGYRPPRLIITAVWNFVYFISFIIRLERQDDLRMTKSIVQCHFQRKDDQMRLPNLMPHLCHPRSFGIQMISGWQNPSSSVISKGRMIKWDYQISCLISVIQGRSVSKWSQDDKIPSFRSRSGMHQRLGGEKTGWFWNGSNEHWMTVLTGMNNEWHSNTVCAIPKCDTWSPSSSFPWFYFHHLISFYRRSDDIISSNDIRMTFDLVPLSLRTHIYRSFSARSGLERHVLHPQVRFS